MRNKRFKFQVSSFRFLGTGVRDQGLVFDTRDRPLGFERVRMPFAFFVNVNAPVNVNEGFAFTR